MEIKIIWIVDNPYGEKFTATRADANVTSDITREQAKAMLGVPGVWMSAKAEVHVPQEEELPGVAKQEYSYSFWN